MQTLGGAAGEMVMCLLQELKSPRRRRWRRSSPPLNPHITYDTRCACLWIEGTAAVSADEDQPDQDLTPQPNLEEVASWGRHRM